MIAAQEWQEEILAQCENNTVTHSKQWIGRVIGKDLALI
jgi:hypothetical protein